MVRQYPHAAAQTLWCLTRNGSAITASRTSPAQTSHKERSWSVIFICLGSVCIQIRQSHNRQTGFICGRQNNLGGSPGAAGLFPSGCAQTPSVTCLQAWKIIFWARCHQIISGRLAEVKEIICHDCTNGMAADILRAGMTTAIAEKTCYRFDRTRNERPAQYIALTPTAKTFTIHRFFCLSVLIYFHLSVLGRPGTSAVQTHHFGFNRLF